MMTDNPVVKIVSQPVQVVRIVSKSEVVKVVISGPQGPPAPPDAITVNAAVALGADRAVTLDGYHCDSTSLQKYAGVTVASSVLGGDVEVHRTGQHVVNGGTFTPNAAIYIGAAGTLTQTIQPHPFKRIGWAITNETINLDPQPSIYLGEN